MGGLFFVCHNGYSPNHQTRLLGILLTRLVYCGILKGINLLRGVYRQNMAVQSLAWCLPRPRKANKYRGGFPEHFEKRLLKLLTAAPWDLKVLHPFGGMSEYGVRVDLDPGVSPHVIGDAHCLPFKDDVFDVVILDPPYSNDESRQLYDSGEIHFRRYQYEAVRVLKPGGYLVMYHRLSLPGAPSCRLVMRILLETRCFRAGRIIHVRQKAML